LSTRPETLKRVREEFDAVLGDAPLNHADLPQLEFTTQVIHEGLRLYPPFWMIDREAVADDEIGDVKIPRGSTVIVYVYGAHHTAKNWENPEVFDEGRFVKGSDKLRTPFTFVPFGGGPRVCIGNHYAILQILMILSVVLRKYDFEVVPGQSIGPRAMVILRPKHGIKMTFTPAKPRARCPFDHAAVAAARAAAECPHAVDTPEPQGVCPVER
jgi:cytochrome P450